MRDFAEEQRLKVLEMHRERARQLAQAEQKRVAQEEAHKREQDKIEIAALEAHAETTREVEELECQQQLHSERREVCDWGFAMHAMNTCSDKHRGERAGWEKTLEALNAQISAANQGEAPTETLEFEDNGNHVHSEAAVDANPNEGSTAKGWWQLVLEEAHKQENCAAGHHNCAA